ncbi:MAG: sulfatase-like hydrolase/transferase, partial [Chitinophagales bacterium]|nr:sulfatase-like hydrolase/transferase [Chitinophagales bacterium]
DNGFSLGEKNHWTKAALWETDIRVPFIIKAPGYAGARVTTPVSLLDLFPTLCDLTGLNDPVNADSSRYLDGESLVPLFTNDHAFGEERVIISSVKSSGSEGSCFPQYSMRSKTNHYIKYAIGNIATDTTCIFDSTYTEKEFYTIGAARDIDPYEWDNKGMAILDSTVMEYMEQWLPGGSLYMPDLYIAVDDEMTNLNEEMLTLFPNPCDRYLHVLYSNTQTQNTLFIFDATGVLKGSEKINAINNTPRLDVSDLEPGYYILVIKTDQAIMRGSFIKG